MKDVSIATDGIDKLRLDLKNEKEKYIAIKQIDKTSRKIKDKEYILLKEI